eukprot:scaffold131_cov335-Pavlova_lutheri.AAC.8
MAGRTGMIVSSCTSVSRRTNRFAPRSREGEPSAFPNRAPLPTRTLGEKKLPWPGWASRSVHRGKVLSIPSMLRVRWGIFPSVCSQSIPIPIDVDGRAATPATQARANASRRESEAVKWCLEGRGEGRRATARVGGESRGGVEKVDGVRSTQDGWSGRNKARRRRRLRERRSAKDGSRERPVGSGDAGAAEGDRGSEPNEEILAKTIPVVSLEALGRRGTESNAFNGGKTLAATSQRRCAQEIQLVPDRRIGKPGDDLRGQVPLGIQVEGTLSRHAGTGSAHTLGNTLLYLYP